MCNLPDIKSLTRNLVQIIGGPKEAAHVCDVSQAEISYWCNDAHDRVIPLDHFLQLDAVAGNRGLTELAYVRGITRPTDAKPNRTLSINKTIAELARAAGELEYTTLDAADDGELTHNEKRRIRDRTAPLKNIIHTLEEVIA